MPVKIRFPEGMDSPCKSRRTSEIVEKLNSCGHPREVMLSGVPAGATKGQWRWGYGFSQYIYYSPTDGHTVHTHAYTTYIHRHICQKPCILIPNTSENNYNMFLQQLKKITITKLPIGGNKIFCTIRHRPMTFKIHQIIPSYYLINLWRFLFVFEPIMPFKR